MRLDPKAAGVRPGPPPALPGSLVADPIRPTVGRPFLSFLPLAPSSPVALLSPCPCLCLSLLSRRLLFWVPDRLFLFCLNLATGFARLDLLKGSLRRCRMEGRGLRLSVGCLAPFARACPSSCFAFCGPLSPRLSPPAPPLAKRAETGFDSRRLWRPAFALPRPIDSPPPIAFRFAGSFVDLFLPFFSPFFFRFFPSPLAGSRFCRDFGLRRPRGFIFLGFARGVGAVSAACAVSSAGLGGRLAAAQSAGGRAAKVCLKLSKGE